MAATKPITEQEPAKIKPYSYLSDIQPTPEVEGEPTLRVGPKVKRTGIPGDTALLGAQPIGPPVEESEKGGEGMKAGATKAPSPPVLFFVRKWDYEVFEKVFDLSVKGALKQRDFIQVSVQLPFYQASFLFNGSCLSKLDRPCVI